MAAHYQAAVGALCSGANTAVAVCLPVLGEREDFPLRPEPVCICAAPPPPPYLAVRTDASFRPIWKLFEIMNVGSSITLLPNYCNTLTLN